MRGVVEALLCSSPAQMNRAKNLIRQLLDHVQLDYSTMNCGTRMVLQRLRCKHQGNAFYFDLRCDYCARLTMWLARYEVFVGEQATGGRGSKYTDEFKRRLVAESHGDWCGNPPISSGVRL